jgi:hypothetical protein
LHADGSALARTARIDRGARLARRLIEPVIMKALTRIDMRTGDVAYRDVRARLRACEACHEPTTNLALCADCLDRSRPHRDDDPYDDIGGESGVEV